MSPPITIFILVFSSAAASAKSSSVSGSMISDIMVNNLYMAMALSRLPPDKMSMVGRDLSSTITTDGVTTENKNVWNARIWFKVFPKWLKTMGFLEKEHSKEETKRLLFRTAIITQAILQALKGDLTLPTKNTVKLRKSSGTKKSSDMSIAQKSLSPLPSNK